MSFLGRLLAPLTRLNPIQQSVTKALPSLNLANEVTSNPNASIGGLYDMIVRHRGIRCYFPRPSERKRIKRHGFWKRMSTRNGQIILMRRILKGRYVISH